MTLTFDLGPTRAVRPEDLTPVGYGDYLKQSWDDARRVSNLNADAVNLTEAYEAVNARIAAATGAKDLFNPYMAEAGLLTPVARPEQWDGTAFQGDPVANWKRKISELAQQHPDKLDWSGVLDEPERTAAARMKATREETSDMTTRAGLYEPIKRSGLADSVPGLGPIADALVGQGEALVKNLATSPVMTSAGLVGSIAGSFTSAPEAVANVLGFGGGKALSVAKNAMINAGVNVAAQAPISALKQESYKQAGLPYGYDVWMQEVAGAAAGGAAIDAGFRLPARALRIARGTDTGQGGLFRDAQAQPSLPAPPPVREAVSPEVMEKARAGDVEALREVATKTGAIEDPVVKGALDHAEMGGKVNDEFVNKLREVGIDDGEGLRTLHAVMTNPDAYVRMPEPVRPADAPLMRDEAAQLMGERGAELEQAMAGIEPRIAQGIMDGLEAGLPQVVAAVRDALGGVGAKVENASQRLTEAIAAAAEAMGGPERFAAQITIHTSRDVVRVAAAMRSHPDLVDSSVSLRTDFMRVARALQAMDDEAWGRVQSGNASPAFAAEVANLSPPGQHAAILDDLMKANPRNVAAARALIPDLIRKAPEPMERPGIKDPAGPEVDEQIKALEDEHAEAIKEAMAPIKERKNLESKVEDLRGEIAKLEEQQKKGAAPENLFAFAGENAKTADKAKLARAKTMEKEGFSRNDIRTETGWFRVPSGDWKFEISDVGAKETGKAVEPGDTLADHLVHPELFKAYPQLAKLAVKKAEAGSTSVKAAYMPKGKGGITGLLSRLFGNSPDPYIGVSARTDTKSFLHEADHAIHDIEGGFKNVDKSNPYAAQGYRGSDFEKTAHAVADRSDLTPEEREARPPWFDWEVAGKMRASARVSASGDISVPIAMPRDYGDKLSIGLGHNAILGRGDRLLPDDIAAMVDAAYWRLDEAAGERFADWAEQAISGGYQRKGDFRQLIAELYKANATPEQRAAALDYFLKDQEKMRIEQLPPPSRALVKKVRAIADDWERQGRPYDRYRENDPMRVLAETFSREGMRGISDAKKIVKVREMLARDNSYLGDETDVFRKALELVEERVGDSRPMFAIPDNRLSDLAKKRAELADAETELAALKARGSPELYSLVMEAAAVRKERDLVRAIDDAFRLADQMLPADTRVEVRDNVESQGYRLDAMSDTTTGDIALATYALNPAARLGHEGVHTLVTRGLVSPAEVGLLAKAAREADIDFKEDQYREAYKDRPNLDSLIDEEAAAHYVEAVIAGKIKKPDTALARIVGAIKAAIERVKNAVTGAGYKTPEELANALLAGEAARRAPVQRWMRENDITAMATRPGVMAAMGGGQGQVMFALAGESADTIAAAAADRFALPNRDPYSVQEALGQIISKDRGAIKNRLAATKAERDEAREFIALIEAARTAPEKDALVAPGISSRVIERERFGREESLSIDVFRDGRQIATVSAVVEDRAPEVMAIDWIETVGGGRLSVADVRAIRESIRGEFPDIERFVGNRISGAKARAFGEGDSRRQQSVTMFALSDSSTGQSMRRDLDALGFYSQALEAARGLKQAKGTPEQMLAQLKAAGVKQAEIEATGLDKLFDDPSVKGFPITRDEIVRYLEENRVGLKEVKYRSFSVAEKEARIEALRSRLDGLNTELSPRDIATGRRSIRGRIADWRYDRIYAEIVQLEAEISALESNPQNARFQNYSLDPSNPTYRETVLHLPDKRKSAELEIPRLTRQIDDLVKVNGDPDTIRTLRNQLVMARRGDFSYLKPDETAFIAGHFPEPNITGHMMTSMVKHEGRPVYLIDQIQSDWGQKLRDGGVRDEAKIAELKRRESELAPQVDAWDKKIRTEWGWNPKEHGYKVDAWAKVNRRDVSEFERLKSELRLVDAELRTAEASSPGNPLVNTTDQWTTTTLRRAIRQAAEADADYIAIPHGDTVLSYNPGDTNGMREFYGTRTGNGIVPKNLRNILGKIDKASPSPTKVETLDAPSSTRGHQDGTSYKFDANETGFTLFPLTPAVKASVREQGQPMFAIRDTIEAEAITSIAPPLSARSNPLRAIYRRQREEIRAVEAEIGKLYTKHANDERAVLADPAYPALNARLIDLTDAPVPPDWRTDGEPRTIDGVAQEMPERAPDPDPMQTMAEAYRAGGDDAVRAAYQAMSDADRLKVRILMDEQTQRPEPQRKTTTTKYKAERTRNDGFDDINLYDDTGAHIADAEVTADGATLTIHWIETTSRQLSLSDIKGMRNSIRLLYPEVTTFEGVRVSGAKDANFDVGSDGRTQSVTMFALNDKPPPLHADMEAIDHLGSLAELARACRG